MGHDFCLTDILIVHIVHREFNAILASEYLQQYWKYNYYIYEPDTRKGQKVNQINTFKYE